jgi:hypothetical protein
MLATGEKTPTPASRAAPSSSEPSPSTKNVGNDGVLGPPPRAGVEGWVEAPEGEVSVLSGKAAMEIGTWTAGMVWEVLVSVLWIWGSELASGCVTNEDLCDVDAVGSPSVRAII